MNCARPKVAVVLVTWNSIAHIEDCVRSLRTNTDKDSFDLFVLDNGSTDGTVEWLLSNLAKGEVVLLGNNRGWVRSLNIALTTISADYCFFLNPDTRVGSGWLPPLVGALQRAPDIAFASPKFLYPDGTLHYAGALVGRSRAVTVRGHGEKDRGFYNEACRVPFAHGQCMVRVETIDKVGGYDEGYGLGYFEEVDVQIRARRLGFGAAYVPASVIEHVTAASFDRHPGQFKERLMTGNWLRTITVHWPAKWIGVRIFLELARPARAILSGRSPRPIFGSWWDWLTALPSLLARRRMLRREGTMRWKALLRTESLARTSGT